MGKPPNIDVNVKEQARIKQQEKYEKISRENKKYNLYTNRHTQHTSNQNQASIHTTQKKRQQ